MTSTFGYPAEAIEPSYDWWRARVHPDDRARVDLEFNNAITAEDTPGFTQEYRFQAFDGSWHTFSIEASSSARSPGRRRMPSAP